MCHCCVSSALRTPLAVRRRSPVAAGVSPAVGGRKRRFGRTACETPAATSLSARGDFCGGLLEVALLKSSGTRALQRPPPPVMIPARAARYPTAADQALHWRECDLCRKAPVIRTQPVSTARRKTVAPDLRVRRVTLHGLQTPDSAVRRYRNRAVEDFFNGLSAHLWQTIQRHVTRIKLSIVRRESWKTCFHRMG